MKKKEAKRILVLLLAAMVAGSLLAGCGSVEEEMIEESVSAEEEPPVEEAALIEEEVEEIPKVAAIEKLDWTEEQFTLLGDLVSGLSDLSFDAGSADRSDLLEKLQYDEEIVYHVSVFANEVNWDAGGDYPFEARVTFYREALLSYLEENELDAADFPGLLEAEAQMILVRFNETVTIVEEEKENDETASSGGSGSSGSSGSSGGSGSSGSSGSSGGFGSSGSSKSSSGGSGSSSSNDGTVTVRTDIANQIVSLVNTERANAGLPALSTNSKLTSAAQIRAQEIITTFSHTRPNGSSCVTVLSEVGYSFSAAGENIAAGQSSASSVMNSWMNSSGHKANILGEQFKEIGVGVVSCNGTLYFVQLFGG